MREQADAAADLASGVQGQECGLLAAQSEVLGADFLENSRRANHHDIKPEVHEKNQILLNNIYCASVLG